MSTLALTTEHPQPAVHRIGARAAWLGFAVVLAAMVMDLLDSTIAQTAAPAIRRELGGSFASLEWISAAYTLAMSVMLLLGSRLGDILGRRRSVRGGLGAVRPGTVTGRADRGPRAAGRDRGDHGAAGIRADPRTVRG